MAESLVLADRMFRKGKIAEAEPMYERSLAMLIRTYAEAHPDVDACLLRLGDIYFARDKYAQALSTYGRLHGLRSRTLSIHHMDTIAISFKIAKCQEKLERFEEAVRTYQEAIGLGEQWMQPGHPLVGSMMEGYAILLRKGMNDPQRASEVEQRAKEFRKKYTGPKGTASRIPSMPSSRSLPFAPSDSGVSMAPTPRLTPPEPIEEPPPPVHIRDESALETDFEDEQPAPKNFLMIAFVVLIALIVPTFIGWMMIQHHPKIELAQPVQPTSFGATTMPITGSEGVSQEPVLAPIERRAEPAMGDSSGSKPGIIRPR